jgi:hypothetical protein
MRKINKTEAERAKAIAIAYPTYSVLKRHEKKLAENIDRLGKMKASENVERLCLHLSRMRDFLKLYEEMEENNLKAMRR